MTERSIFANLNRDADGIATACYGPYTLKSAFQPILRETSEGMFSLEAIEGLVRVECDGALVAPADFLALVPQDDRPMVDSLCRSLHILNAGSLCKPDAVLLVNSQPGLFRSAHAIRQEIDRMRLAAHEAALAPSSIACEIRELPDDDDAAAHLSRHLHDAGFLVAIDGYAAQDGDLARLARLAPDLLKFDPIWVQRFGRQPTAAALLRVIVAQLEREGIRPIVANIEEAWQMELCREIGMPLMQGYLLARPQLAPTSFGLDFPDPDETAMGGPATLPNEAAPTRGRRSFGRRTG
ncbi:EAL domain-containing protein (putative c-di-GMP-specific phosphodiesterase class I) [Rhizobium subbaraonis]|uniref:EAL domain-containing protein (Putative c-di-GMP-specific phosphodiesterase class I) n=1 Tax=Rhizobium subbaraonis TaxID=908946 RepID=A0A285UVB7_9HYPH|nr:EAL domain-containing protein [Rhizobium subbaraonis]SOC45834.1 EAL domain-containing protein (putative c-di-GMP-specific phosphodiesterase class I) [Rhizobium subbaraonis]